MADTYRVTGEQPVAAHERGQQLTDADLAAYGVTTPEQKTLLLESGALTPIRKTGKEA